MSAVQEGRWFKAIGKDGSVNMIFRDDHDHIAYKNDAGKWEYDTKTWDLISWRDDTVFEPVSDPNI